MWQQQLQLELYIIAEGIKKVCIRVSISTQCESFAGTFGSPKLMDYTLALYHGLVKVRSLTKEHPSPIYFWPIFLYKVKVHSNERPLWNELHVEFDMYSLKHYACLR